MHCALDITPRLFKCTSCPTRTTPHLQLLSCVQTTWRGRKTGIQTQPALLKQIGLFDNADLTDLCTRCRQRPAVKTKIGYGNSGFWFFFFFYKLHETSFEKAPVPLTQACGLISWDTSTGEHCYRWPHWQIHSNSQGRNLTCWLSHHLCDVSLTCWRLQEGFHLMLPLVGNYLPLKTNMNKINCKKRSMNTHKGSLENRPIINLIIKLFFNIAAINLECLIN